MSANGSRSLDRTIRTLRSLMRTYNLPRPDRLVISTRSGSVHAEFTSGTAPDRLAALLVWVTRIEGVTLTWTLRPDHTLTVAATGRNRAGLAFGLTASADVTDLDGTPGRGGLVVLGGQFRLAPMVVEPVTFEEVARLVHLGRAVSARRRAVSSAVAA